MRYLSKALLPVVLSSLIVLVGLIMPAVADSNAYQTGLIRWPSGSPELANWLGIGVTRGAYGSVWLDPQTAQIETDPYPAGTYEKGNFYNGGQYIVGEITSPITSTEFPFYEALASWNAETPPGTWVEMLIRARRQERWTGWYNLGVWASDASTIQRHSVKKQLDLDGDVSVDTLALDENKPGAEALQLRVRLFSTQPDLSPILRRAAVAYSTSFVTPASLSTGDPKHWNRILSLPECSQMVYKDGGENWCSPTSVSMVMGYWFRTSDPCEPRVRQTVEGVFDRVYDGHGNWLFNTAYAGSRNLDAHVARFTSLDQVEPWITAGVPVVFSFAWKVGELTGSAIPKSFGHLAVMVGFDAQGNPIVNDPAAASDDQVQRTYDRRELETLWLKYAGGTVYLIYPPGWKVPSVEPKA